MKVLFFWKGSRMKNSKIKIKLAETGMKQWELARLLDLSESALSRKLRDELTEEEQNEIVNLIVTGGESND